MEWDGSFICTNKLIKLGVNGRSRETKGHAMATQKGDADKLPSVERPPLSEVVYDLKFEPLSDFKAPHFGWYWERIADEYPNIDQKIPIGWPRQGEQLNTMPIPRVWFLDGKGQTLIQVQDDRFIFNWRKTEDDNEYIRFSKLFPKFKENFSVFSEFLKEKNIGEIKPDSCELAYINQIPKSAVWDSYSEIQRVLPDLSWRNHPGRFLGGPEKFLWKMEFPLSEDFGRALVKVQSGTRRIDEQPLIMLELRVSGLGEDKSLDAIWRWFDMAHEWIVNTFFDITSPEMHDYWGRRND